MRALHQGFKFLHPTRYIYGQVGVYIIVILDCVRRTRPSLYYVSIVERNAIRLIVA